MADIIYNLSNDKLNMHSIVTGITKNEIQSQSTCFDLNDKYVHRLLYFVSILYFKSIDVGSNSFCIAPESFLLNLFEKWGYQVSVHRSLSQSSASVRIKNSFFTTPNNSTL